MSTQKTTDSARPTQVEPAGLVIIAGIALAIIGFTLRTWVDFNIVHLRGVDADGMTSVGDGYFVIALAVLAIALSAALYLRPAFWMALLPAIGLSTVAIAAIAAYEAATPWSASGFDIHGALVTGGHVTAAVYVVFALTALMGLTAAILAGIHYQRLIEESDQREANLTAKGPSHDQPHPGPAGRLGSR